MNRRGWRRRWGIKFEVDGGRGLVGAGIRKGFCGCDRDSVVSGDCGREVWVGDRRSGRGCGRINIQRRRREKRMFEI